MLFRSFGMYGEWLRSIQPQGEGAMLASMIRKIILQVGVKFTTFIDSLTIDLLGAEPGNAHLEIAMIGNPVDSPAMWARIKNGEGRLRAEEPMQTLGDLWIKHSLCEWIPYTQGQGLRLTGNFLKVVPGVFVSQPSKVSLRLRYRTPLTSLLGALSYVGGERGVAFTVSSSSGVVQLRDDPTPELDRASGWRVSWQYSH